MQGELYPGSTVMVTSVPFKTVEIRGVEVRNEAPPEHVRISDMGVVCKSVREDDVEVTLWVQRSDVPVTIDKASVTVVAFPPRAGEPQIDVDTAAHVLHAFGAGGYPAGGFVSALIAACALADSGNLRLMGRGFPAYARAVDLVKNHAYGTDELRRLIGQ